jgi:hypothetical protein
MVSPRNKMTERFTSRSQANQEHASGDNNNLPRLFTNNEGLQKMLLSWGRINAANLLKNRIGSLVHLCFNKNLFDTVLDCFAT